jgi:hypothetical protein
VENLLAKLLLEIIVEREHCPVINDRDNPVEIAVP